jgi:hypothetical protein
MWWQGKIMTAEELRPILEIYDLDNSGTFDVVCAEAHAHAYAHAHARTN